MYNEPIGSPTRPFSPTRATQQAFDLPQAPRASWAYTSNQELKKRIVELRTGSHIDRQVDNYAIQRLREEQQKLEVINTDYLEENQRLENELEGICGENAFEKLAQHNDEVRQQMQARIEGLMASRPRGGSTEELMQEISQQITFLHQNNVLLAKANQLLKREVEEARELKADLDRRYFRHVNTGDGQRAPLGVRWERQDTTIWKIVTCAALVFAFVVLV